MGLLNYINMKKTNKASALLAASVLI